MLTPVRAFPEVIRLQQPMIAAGALPIDISVLQSAELFLDLYGEDIRGRTYTTFDPFRGEQMLRPDFTVPVAEHHMTTAAGAHRYTYAGSVFRRPEQDGWRQREFVQVGYEVFNVVDTVAADIEVFALFGEILAPFDLRRKTGDMSIVMAAVQGLSISDGRKSALMRHIWRPQRFRALMDRYAGRTPVPASQRPLMGDSTDWHLFPEFGVRRREDVHRRIARLREDFRGPQIPPDEFNSLEALLEIRTTMPQAIEQLTIIAGDLPAIKPAVDRLTRRRDGLVARGVAVSSIEFEVCYGRTQMEYYDGFVFGFLSDDHPRWPPVSTGGRYDALTKRLGRGTECPAVGGVILSDLIGQLS
ncbi:MAG: ATP phosphoribosyltransferase regulatory subunit [Aestuariivita sp.]|nr:ATP phosphoribosyltransferase regulatory subunit [Aestuariivita sp.]MCY4201193.1 ATP phosphoribosyltransferase regulatory subunit [Aestuariivita sp.]